MEDNKIVICPATAFAADGAKSCSPLYKEPFFVVQRYGQAFVRQLADGCLNQSLPLDRKKGEEMPFAPSPVCHL